MSDALDPDAPGEKAARNAGSDAAEAHEQDAPERGREPQPCMPCHGTGKVISNLGGHSRTVKCPWCRGGGMRLVGADAQEWQQEQAASRAR
jgi:DnaJ-class molecular chaperone